MASVEAKATLLSRFGQGHLLDYCDNEVDDEGRRRLLRDLDSIDFEEMRRIYDRASGSLESSAVFDPSTMEPIDDDLCGSAARSTPEEQTGYREAALEAMGEGEVGVLLLAGGQGTRLGVPYPKGMYDIGLPSGKSLYQVQVERLLRLEAMAPSNGRGITLYVMTSDHTKEATVEFFERHGHFGMDPGRIVFFEQRMLPCFATDGRILLASETSVARAPDGNGGLYWALGERGVLEDMRRRGIRYLHVYCVDNVLVKIADPLFVGYCIAKGAEAGNKVCEKTHPKESVGVVCKVEGRYQVVEYSEIGEQASEARRSDGRLVYNAGNICNHFFTLDFVERVVREREPELPHHVARKKIPTVGGAKVDGFKMEKFVFDVFAFADRFVVWECDRDEEFSPLKNADGAAKDTPTTARQSLFRLHRRYLESAGAKVAPEVEQVEVSPLVSYAGEGLEDRVQGKSFDAKVVLLQ